MKFHSDTKIMQKIFDNHDHDGKNYQYKTQLKNNIQLVRASIFDYEMRLKKILNSPTRMYYTEFHQSEQQTVDDIVDIYHYMKKKLKPSHPILLNGIKREIDETLRLSNPDIHDYIIQDRLNHLRLMVSEIQLVSSNINKYALFLFLILLSLSQYKILSKGDEIIGNRHYIPSLTEFPESMQNDFHNLKNDAITMTPHLFKHHDYLQKNNYSNEITIYDFHQLELIQYNKWRNIFGLEN